MPFSLQKLTRWKQRPDGSTCLVGAMGPMIAVRETFEKLCPQSSDLKTTAIYRLWHTDKDVNTFWESGNSDPVAVDTLVAIINFTGFMVICDLGHKIIPVTLQLSRDEPVVLSECYTQFQWIRAAGTEEYREILASIDLGLLQSECKKEITPD